MISAWRKTTATRNHLIILMALLYFFAQMETFAAGSDRVKQEKQPLAQLDQYNIIWNTPSEDAAGSMPLGNGDIALNAWV